MVSLSLAVSAIYLLLSLYYFYTKLETGYLVYISNGIIIGDQRTTSYENKTYYSFRGIPYAQPPIGELRFAAPVPADSWLVPRLAIEDGNECLQSEGTGSEDCLFINVYTPTLNSSHKLPVMVWIYGGYFSVGDADYTSFGPDYLLEQDVVVVDFNYRLGIFGFLSTEDEEALGNWGIKDQILALKWVQENIEMFGGNKSCITLFGQSAGAASVSYLSQMPQTKGLFHKMILQSGSSINIWALSRKARAVAFIAGSALDINTTDSKTLVDELREIDASKLLLVSLETDIFSTIIDNQRNGLTFGPVIEYESNESVITWKSHEKLSNGDFHRVPVIIGFTSDEAGEFSSFVEYLRVFLLSYDTYPTKLVPADMNLNASTETDVALEIKSYYFGNVSVAYSDDEVEQFITDDQFIRPTHEAARLMSNYTSVYFYKISYVGEYEKSTRGNDTGVYHSDDLFWIWNLADRSQDIGGSDLQMRYRMLKLWTNFAKYGNPTPQNDTTLDSVTWNQVDPKNISYLDIGDQLIMNNDFSNYSIDFWQQLYNEYGNQPFDTY